MELRAESGANPARWIRRESGALDPARIRRAGSGALPTPLHFLMDVQLT